MQHVIEFEETKKVHHQIFVEAKDDTQIDGALDTIENSNVEDLEDVLQHLEQIVNVSSVNREYDIVSCEMEYYDNYPLNDEEK